MITNPVKHICIIIPALMSCGVTTAAMNLARALIRNKANVCLISLTKTKEILPPEDIPTHYLYSDKLSYRQLETRGTIAQDAKALKALISQISSEQGFDLFLSNTAWCDRIMTVCDFPNTHHIIHESTEKTWQNIGLFRAKKYRCWQWFRALKGRSLICVSQGVSEGIQKHQRIKPAHIDVIYNTFDIENIEKQKSAYIPDIENKDYIIHVGRFCKEKRYDVLFEALKKLPETTLVLLAKHPKNTLKLAQSHGVSEQVIVVDFQQNPFPWIAEAKLLVLSSDTEGLGMVLIESLICGTPVVSTDCDYGPREILTGELAAYLSPINDADALATNIRSALTGYPDIHQAEILKKIAPDTITQAYLALCQS